MSIGLEVILFLAVYLAIAEQFIQPLGGSMGFYDGWEMDNRPRCSPALNGRKTQRFGNDCAKEDHNYHLKIFQTLDDNYQISINNYHG